MPKWTWRGEGEREHELYYGKLYVGSVIPWGRHGEHAGQWRAWFHSDSDGVHIGWYPNAIEAKTAVEVALADAIQ